MTQSPCISIDQILANRSQVAAETPQWLDNDRIAFLSGLAGEPALWSIDAGGGFPMRLTAAFSGMGFMAARLVRISPDRRWIAYLTETNGTPEVWLWPTDGGPAQQLTRLGANINALSWSPDSQAIALSGNRHGFYAIYLADVDGATTRLTHHALNEVFPSFTPDGREILFVRLDERWADHDVLAIPAAGGDERLVIRDTDYFDYRIGATFGHAQVSPDGQSVLFRSYRSGYMNYWLAPIGGGEPRLLAAEEADQTGAVWSPDGQQIAYCSNHNGTIALHVASVGRGEARPRPLVTPEVGLCMSPAWSPDGKRIAYLFQTPTSPLDLYVVASDGGAPRQLTHSRLSGAEGYLIEPEKITYPTFDGRAIHAYVYAPPASAPGAKRPCIIWTHGGPSMQWDDEFYDYIQYFALRGYLVLAPNVRGSTGYSRAFEDLNNADWGYGDLQDVLAAVAYLKTRADVDPARMAITGTSYGGYLTAAAVCFAQNVFQAAISASGYPDRVAMYFEQEQGHIKQMEFKFGPFETHKHIYEKCSPQRWAKQATTPCFVLNGEGKLPRSEGARNFALALEKEYKTVQYKAYPGEGYYVQGLANTRQMWLDMEAFLERYL